MPDLSWINRYRAYDDGALEALANPGLLRRAAKDVELSKVQWREADGATGKLSAGNCRDHETRKGGRTEFSRLLEFSAALHCEGYVLI